jgi:hypothetical protein
MSNTRTDIHSPSNLVTEDYEYAYSYDAHPEEGDRGLCVAILTTLIEDGWRFGQVHGGDTCDHCGTQLRYVAVLKHIPTHTLIKVGETCLDNRFALASGDFHRLRKAASLNRERKRLADKRAEFLATDPDRQAAYDYASANAGWDDYGDEDFNGKYARFVDRYGEASDKFTAAILRGKARQEAYEAKRAAEQAAASPVVAGDAIVITGEIVKLGVTNGQFPREVMTVRDDRGFKVWGTQPRSLYDARKGDRVTFTAAVEVSDRDETFGFFKRPKKATVVGASAV